MEETKKRLRVLAEKIADKLLEESMQRSDPVDKHIIGQLRGDLIRQNTERLNIKTVCPFCSKGKCEDFLVEFAISDVVAEESVGGENETSFAGILFDHIKFDAASEFPGGGEVINVDTEMYLKIWENPGNGTIGLRMRVKGYMSKE